MVYLSSIPSKIFQILDLYFSNNNHHSINFLQVSKLIIILARLYLLAIPIIIGIFSAIIIASIAEDDNSSTLLTTENLIKNGSPF